MQCLFSVAWLGQCKNETPCSLHSTLKCVSCSNIATHECTETGMFICGALLCEQCEHTIAQDGTNGGHGVSFSTTSPLPGGYKAHCKKAEQLYTPWYTRQENMPTETNVVDLAEKINSNRLR